MTRNLLCRAGRKDDGDITIGFLAGRTRREIKAKQKELGIRCHGEYLLYKPVRHI